MVLAQVVITALVKVSIEIEKSAGVASRSLALSAQETATLSPAEFTAMESVLSQMRTNGLISYVDPVDAAPLYCNFIVDHANGNGLGLRSLKGPGIAAVYMNTSATPAAGNPNPQAGVILVQLDADYAQYVYGNASMVAPTSGTNLPVDATDAALTVHDAYVITVLGTTTTADWVALGVPAGVTPQVGLPFIATATGHGTGTGQVQAPKATGSGVTNVQAIGDNNLAVMGGTYGSNGYLIVGCWAGSTPALTAPADGTVIAMSFILQEQGSAEQS